MHIDFVRLPEVGATQIMFNLKVEQLKTNWQQGGAANGRA